MLRYTFLGGDARAEGVGLAIGACATIEATVMGTPRPLGSSYSFLAPDRPQKYARTERLKSASMRLSDLE